jgi:isochorismate synthase
MADILEKAIQQLKLNLPFVIYSKPNSTILTGLFQKNSKLYETMDFKEKGFVFADFKGNQAIIFLESESALLQEEVIFAAKNQENSTFEIAENGKEAFRNLVKKGIQAIEKGSFEKVVLSRKETLEIDIFSFLETFEKLLSKYPAALRYCWFHPKIGMWMGATPEQLLKIENSVFKTVALAGTQKFQENATVVWQEKEKQEQQFVTDFIISSLNSEAVDLNKTKVYTFQAGNLVHLKTDIEGVFKMDFDLKKVIGILHPTPAVCGLPTQDAKAFILAEEGYERKFYAGFLGEINNNQQGDVDLFVNLRCMEVQENQVHLYIGCGITKDSNPEKEYFETANKAMTMKQIL